MVVSYNKQHFACQDINYKLVVDYCGVFISCLESHSDGTHSLQRIHCNADVMLDFFKYVQMKKQTHLHIGWPEGEYIFSMFLFLK